MIDKDKQHNAKQLKKINKSDFKPWIPANSSLEALAISRKYLQVEKEEE